jgi:hypothetical protein
MFIGWVYQPDLDAQHLLLLVIGESKEKERS